MTAFSPENQTDSPDVFPVKKASVALSVGLGLLFSWIYLFWWFFSRRKSLNSLSGRHVISLGLLLPLLVLVSIDFSASIGASYWLDLANMQGSDAYFETAQSLYWIGGGAGVTSILFYLLQCFRIKRALDVYRRKKDRFQSSFSGWLTFFFGVFYLQYAVNQLHSPVRPDIQTRYCFSNSWLCVLYTSLAVFLVVLFAMSVMYWFPPLLLDEGDAVVYVIVLCVIVVKLVTDCYAGDWSAYAKKVPLFLIAAFFCGLYCGAMVGNALRVDERLLASAPPGLAVKSSSEATDLVGYNRYLLGTTTTYMPRLRKRNNRLEWVVWVSSESYRKKWVIDAATGEILQPNPLPANYSQKEELFK